MKNPLARTAALCLIIAGAGAARATENAGSSWPTGVEVQYGDMLPPGDYHLVYFERYDADVIKGADGRDNPAFKKFQFKFDAAAYRYQHVWSKDFLGAGMETILAVPFISGQLTKVTGGGASVGNTTNMGDPLIVPVRFAWRGPIVSHSLTVELTAGWGYYNKNQVLNAGRNYWQYAPTYAISVRPTPDLSLKAKVRYGINTTNNAAGYDAGDELGGEYMAGYKTSPNTTWGLSGFYYKQTTNDTINGVPTSSTISPALGGLPGTGTGNRGEVTAIGPCVTHNFSKSFILAAKYQQEFNAVNRAQGNRLWVQTLLPF